MTFETKIIMNFTDSERTALQTAASLLFDLTREADGISDEISKRCNKAYKLITELLDLEG